MIGQTVSHYRILEKLGEGGMGVVYKAEDTKLQRSVALKFLPHQLTSTQEEEARFMQEARAASALNHTNVCTIYAIEEEKDQLFIAMEFVDGKTLRSRIAEGRLHIDEAIQFAMQIGEALQEAHSKGIVHRDVKTDNIMVTPKNQIKVMDFGLAKLKGSLKLTKTTSTVGTLAYMAPEQIEGSEVDGRSDIFSFGVVLFEMLTGHTPFRGEHEAALMYSILNDEPQSLQQYVPDAPSELLHIVNRALEKDREERYQTVHDMLIDLRRLKKDTSRVSRKGLHAAEAPEPSLPAARAPTPRKKWLWLGGAGLVALVLVLTLLPRATAVKLNPNRSFRSLQIPFKGVGYSSITKDGNWAVFPAVDDSGRWDVYWTNTAGGEPSRITHEENFNVVGVDASPEISLVAYDRMEGRASLSEIRIVPIQGGIGRTIVDTGMGPQWRPDGKRIGYMRSGATESGSQWPSASGKLEIWSVRPDGTDNRLEFIDSANKYRSPLAFSWSPDGKSIVWIRNFSQSYGEVMRRELATGKERQLTSDRVKVDEVIWATNEKILFVSSRSGHSNLWVMSSGGGEATQVTQGTVPIISARLTADSRKLLYLQQEQIRHIWMTAFDGSSARQVTSDDVRVNAAAFSPDGSQIAAVLGDLDIFKPETHLTVMDRQGRNRRVLTSGPQVVGSCRWSPDGRWLAYASRSAEEPADSNRIYLIQPSNPGTPRYLGKGSDPWWIDSENISVIRGTTAVRYLTKGGTPTTIYRDSTFGIPLQKSNQMFYYDMRKASEGYWIVSIDSSGRDVGNPKKLPFDPRLGCVFSLDYRLALYMKPTGNEVWRYWMATGKQERVGVALQGTSFIFDVSGDGKELLWLEFTSRSKLALIENLFE